MRIITILKFPKRRRLSGATAGTSCKVHLHCALSTYEHGDSYLTFWTSRKKTAAFFYSGFKGHQSSACCIKTYDASVFFFSTPWWITPQPRRLWGDDPVPSNVCFSFVTPHFDHTSFWSDRKIQYIWTTRVTCVIYTDEPISMARRRKKSKELSLIPINNYIKAYVHKSILQYLFGNKTCSLKPVLGSLSHWWMLTRALLWEN